MFSQTKQSEGSVVILALIFLTALSLMGLSLTNLVITQNKQANVEVAQEYALHIAEAGLSYGRWRLAHNSTDYTTETVVVSDPEGGTVGSYTITFTPPGAGSTIVGIQSDGWYQNDQNNKRILQARYGQKAFTFYAYLFDASVWFGGATADGRIHTNTGIRMDATGNSKVTATNATYTCLPIHGCASGGETKPGVWGSGGNQGLWEFPVSNVDFNAVTTDVAVLKDLAENQGVGLFLSKQGISIGYDLFFQADGTVLVYEIDSLSPNARRYRYEDGKWKLYMAPLDINNETQIQQYTLQPNDLIFSETDTWVHGTVNGRVTVVAARLPENPGNNKDIIIPNNIVYTNYDGTDVLGLIAQDNVLLSLYVPDDMRIDAVMMAQKGMIGRDLWWHPTSFPTCIRNSITTYGSLISKDFSDPEFRWVWGDGSTACGFNNNYNSYDPYLVYTPPPYFPTTGEIDFISWEEKEKNE